jgi:hypothetical protein
MGVYRKISGAMAAQNQVDLYHFYGTMWFFPRNAQRAVSKLAE